MNDLFQHLHTVEHKGKQKSTDHKELVVVCNLICFLI